MRGTHEINWSDREAAAKALAGNWQHNPNFAWQRGHNLEDAEHWMIWYTTNRNSLSYEAEIKRWLRPFSEGANPDVVFELHSHWATGYVTGFSIRVRRADSSVTPAFEEFCRIEKDLEDSSARRFAATLTNYRRQMWNMKDQLPEGWENQVWSWYNAAGWVGYTWASDEHGGRPPKEYILEALESLGLIERKQTPLSSQRPGQVYLKAHRAMLRRVRR